MITIWVIKRDGTISEATNVLDYEISMDYITADKTNFVIHNDTPYTVGDFVMAKYPSGKGLAYFGVIDSYENKKMVCNDISVLTNFEFPATRVSGPSFELHAKTLIFKYLLSDSNKLLNILDIEVKTSTPHVYQPDDPPTPTNLMKYLVNGFKKYNIVWSFNGFSNGRIQTSIEAVTKTAQLKNNIMVFRNWDVSTTEVGSGISNHLMIVDKKTDNSELPIILSEWWLLNDNTVTSVRSNPNIIKPTKSIVNIYDQEEEDKPTYEEVANSDLKGSFYAHEISVDALKGNNIFDPDALDIGTLVTIVYNDRTYQSVLTGFTITDDTDYMQLRFGHIRSRLSEILE